MHTSTFEYDKQLQNLDFFFFFAVSLLAMSLLAISLLELGSIHVLFPLHVHITFDPNEKLNFIVQSKKLYLNIRLTFRVHMTYVKEIRISSFS